MAYERMTLATFSENLKAGKYDTATGARRAVGKSDWGPHDRQLAANAINSYFGEDGSKAAAPRAAKKTAKKAAAKKVAKKAAAKPAAKAAPAAKRAARRAPVATTTVRETQAKDSSATAPTEALRLPVNAVSPSLIGESVVRERNATEIVVALANNAARTPVEERLYLAAVTKATQSLEAPAAPAPKPLPVSLREQLAGQAGQAPAPVSTTDQSILAQAEESARKMVPGFTLGAPPVNSVPSVGHGG
jgi:Meckel syndrome type 1 protein